MIRGILIVWLCLVGIGCGQEYFEPVPQSKAAPTVPKLEQRVNPDPQTTALSRATQALNALYGVEVSPEFTAEIVEAVVWQAARESEKDSEVQKNATALLANKGPDRLEKLAEFYCRAVRGFHDRIYTMKGAQQGLEAAAARLPKQ